MKKYVGILICGILTLVLMGCGNKDKQAPSQSNDKPKEQTKKEDTKKEEPKKEETDLEKVNKVFKFNTTTDEAGSSIGEIKDGGNVKFSVYLSLKGDDEEMAKSIGIKIGDIVYHKDADSETYLVNQNIVFITYTDATPEAMKKDMDSYLASKNISLDQLKKAIKENFNI